MPPAAPRFRTAWPVEVNEKAEMLLSKRLRNVERLVDALRSDIRNALTRGAIQL